MTSVLDRVSSLLPPLVEPNIPDQPKDQLLEDLFALQRLLVKENKWTARTWASSNGRFCMEGGIAEVSDWNLAYSALGLVARDRRAAEHYPRAHALYKAIEQQVASKRSIPAWNDNLRSSRPKNLEKVNRVIEKAISKRLEELTLERAKEVRNQVYGD